MDQLRLNLAKDDVIALKRVLLRERPFADRVSLALALHLQHRYETRADYFPVLHELDFLERYLEKPGKPRVSRTKPATRFEEPPLDRFWHKHFFAPRHLIHNIGANWGLSGNGPGNQKLEAMVQGVAREVGDDPEMWPRHLAYQFVDAGFAARAQRRPQQREGRLTGDWIIFAKHNGKNFYIGLASHEEGDDPKRLYDLLAQNCEAEFPFLFE